jgi:diguanylate cyclase (GGDEF)-like protein
MTPLPLGIESKFLLIVRDVTERKQHLASLSWRATHDDLTGLPNRTLFADRVSQAISEASRSSSGRAVMVIDLDGFKDINDTHGHQAGDDVLRTVAGRLSKSLRAADTVSRLGGDEFGVLLIGDVSSSGVNNIVAKLLTSVEEPISTSAGDVEVTFSVGVAQYPRDGATCEELTSFADQNMYAAKRVHHAADVLAANGSE